jgi:uncharacterized protein YodC (DUF2158 family)
MKAGDVVRLRSGGPPLTISKLSGEGAHCMWFEGDFLHQQVFPAAALAAWESLGEPARRAATDDGDMGEILERSLEAQHLAALQKLHDGQNG